MTCRLLLPAECAQFRERRRRLSGQALLLRSVGCAPEQDENAGAGLSRCLTMRLSDARLRRRPTKLLYPNHRLPPGPNEDAAPRSLEPIVRLYFGCVDSGNAPNRALTVTGSNGERGATRRHPTGMRGLESQLKQCVTKEESAGYMEPNSGLTRGLRSTGPQARR